MREYVLSTSRTSPDPAVRFISGDPLAAIRELKEEEGELGICLVGGAKAAAALLPEIDALLVKRYPVLLGAGTPLFDGAGYAPARSEPVSRHVFDSGADYTLYRRAWPSGGPFPSRSSRPCGPARARWQGRKVEIIGEGARRPRTRRRAAPVSGTALAVAGAS